VVWLKIAGQSSRLQSLSRVTAFVVAWACDVGSVAHIDRAGERGGKPCVRGLRITVYDVLGWLASGMSEADILRDHPDLVHEDILACLRFAADREKLLVTGAR
jgi:uncharacterized protein (DUF433 family)